MGLIRWLKRLFSLTPTPSARVADAPDRAGPSRLSSADVLTRVRALTARDAQWPDIWAELNTGGDPVLQALLVELRNDGLQFAPSDGLRRIELVCEGLPAGSKADATDVLRAVLGKTDVLDAFR